MEVVSVVVEIVVPELKLSAAVVVAVVPAAAVFMN